MSINIQDNLGKYDYRTKLIVQKGSNIDTLNGLNLLNASVYHMLFEIEDIIVA